MRIVALLLLLFPARAQEKQEKLVEARKGALPILLTAPHGGERAIPGAAERKSGVILRDAGTREIAEGVAKLLEEKLGGKPYLVLAHFHRKYADANRKEEEAFEDPAARATYREYHAAVRGTVDEIRRQWPDGAILLDIHGQAADKDTVHRGTQNGRTVAQLLKKHGEAALIGKKSLLGDLEAQGFKVFPTGGTLDAQKENPRYNGGFTVQAYGSGNADGIDAIQLELGADLRTQEREKFEKGLAQAIAAFTREYVKGEVKKPKE